MTFSLTPTQNATELCATKSVLRLGPGHKKEELSLEVYSVAFKDRGGTNILFRQKAIMFFPGYLYWTLCPIFLGYWSPY